MGYSHRNTRPFGSTQRENTQCINMTVNDAPTLLLKEALKFFLIFNNMLIGRNLENSAAKRFNLFTRYKRRIRIDKKIELHFASIDMAIIVHDNSLDATTNHLTNNLSHSDRFGHLARTASGQNLNHCKNNDF